MASPLDELTADTVHTVAQGRVHRIYGPPGTGKSSTLRDMCRDFVAERGPDSTMVTSFTVTAARNIAEMATALPDHNVGTLHSMAYRALGTPNVALDTKVVKDWNKRVPLQWRLQPDGRRAHPELAGDAGPGGSDGDALLSAYDVARSQLQPPEAMPAAVRSFAEAWEKWKSEAEVVDFTDMVRIALERAIEGERAPGQPEILISDEAQDSTPLEIALLLAWGAHAERTVFALDDDQAIMGWRGGDARPILALETNAELGVDVRDTLLAQSWRIPAAVHMVAQSWIELSSFRREKNYHPRPVDGHMYAVGHTLESRATAEAIARDAHAGRSVVVLAACEYMLRPLIANLKAIGVPFANHLRPAEPKWNPLRNPNGMTSAERLYRYLIMDDRALGGWIHEGGKARLWTGDDVRMWLPLVRTDAGLARGAKSAAMLLPAGELSLAQVEGLFDDDDALARATEPELAWLLESALGSKSDVLRYPAAIARAHGPAALVEDPLVKIGTIHSYKGGQAQIVYLCPAVSGAGWAEWLRGGVHRDNTIRQFYVGLTRAIETCVILGSSERSVPRDVLCPAEMQVR